jgi:two-component system, NtrC family, response regulator HydG
MNEMPLDQSEKETKYLAAEISSKGKIAVVDDDTDIQDLISAYFKPRGFEIVVFSDAELAMKECLRSGKTWDVILVDLQLPKMSGSDLCKDLKKLLPITPIILITTTRSAEVAVEAIQQGAYDFIVKPLSFPQLQISVERALYLRTLISHVIELRDTIKSTKTSTSKIFGRSPKFLQALDIAKRVAPSSANILITGESGTGKEVFAKYIHHESQRSKGRFVAINCAAIPENLLESELFGHAKGSFTGAVDKKIGLFEEAQNGTLFLDEIGDLSLQLQAKLLRVLQEKKIRRVGENQDREINCRIISATHRNLPLEVHEQNFREDLFFRLNVIPISIPPLRDRKDDIIPLAESFLRKFAAENGSIAKSFSKDAIRYLLENKWRGNVRELENAIERSVVLSSQSEISMDCFMVGEDSAADSAPVGASSSVGATKNCFRVEFEENLPSLEFVIHEYIGFAIDRNQGAKDKTAKDIGIDRKTLYRRMMLPTESVSLN